MSPQLSYSFDAIAAQPGMAMDNEASSRSVVSVVAGANIAFGTYCELTSAGTCVQMQDSTTGGAFNPLSAGIALFDALGVEQQYSTFQIPPSSTGSSASGWLKGMSVPLMTRGRIWVLGDASGTALLEGAINVTHSSTTGPQGIFTFRAVNAGAGVEVDIAPRCRIWNPRKQAATYTDPFGNTFNVYPVEINLP